MEFGVLELGVCVFRVWSSSEENTKRRREKKEKTRRGQEERGQDRLFDFGQFRLRQVPLSAKWPKSNWPKSSVTGTHGRTDDEFIRRVGTRSSTERALCSVEH